MCASSRPDNEVPPGQAIGCGLVIFLAAGLLTILLLQLRSEGGGYYFVNRLCPVIPIPIEIITGLLAIGGLGMLIDGIRKLIRR